VRWLLCRRCETGLSLNYTSADADWSVKASSQSNVTFRKQIPERVVAVKVLLHSMGALA